MVCPITQGDHNKSLAVAEMGDRAGAKLVEKCVGGCCIPFRGETRPHPTQCLRAEAYLAPSGILI